MESEQHHEEHKKSGLWELYDKKYKTLMIIPILLLVLAIAQIGYQTATTGDFVHKGVTLKGGLTLTVPAVKDVDADAVRAGLLEVFPGNDINIRTMSRAGKQVRFEVEIDLDVNDQAAIDKLFATLSEVAGFDVAETDFTLNRMGSSLGESFFKEIIRVLLIAFLFMGAVVFFYFGEDLKSKLVVALLTIIDCSLIYSFRNESFIVNIIVVIVSILTVYYYITRSMPSFAVIVAAASDIIVTLAIVNIMGMRMSTAGIAAFLMLIGYSVDTDILLSTKVLKSKIGSVMDRIKRAMKTGLTMTFTTLAAVIVALIFTESDVIGQIMTILLIGLLVDLVNTWIQNVGFLRLYLEKKDKEKAEADE